MTDADRLTRTRRDFRPSGQPGAPSPTPTVLMVCTGNICRSPMAEALLRARLGTLEVRVHSAGTRALIGRPMPRRAQRVATANGASRADVARHRAQWLLDPVIDDADLVIGMSRRHLVASVELAPHLLRQTFTAREFDRLAATLTDEQIVAAADAGGDDLRRRLVAAVQLVARRRCAVPQPPPEEYDIVDPYKRTRRVYNASAAQLVPAVDAVARVLRVALRSAAG